MSTKTTTALTRDALIDGVIAHAQKKGQVNGWNYVTQMGREEIDSIIGVRTKSVLGAVQMMTQYGGIREMARAAAENMTAQAVGEDGNLVEEALQDEALIPDNDGEPVLVDAPIQTVDGEPALITSTEGMYDLAETLVGKGKKKGKQAA